MIERVKIHRHGGGARDSLKMLGLGSNNTAGGANSTRANSVPAKARRRRAILWDGNEPEPWQRDLLSLFVRNQLKTALALPILAFILATAGLKWVDFFTSASWFVTVIGCQFLQHILCLKYDKQQFPHIAPIEWLGMITAAEAFMASCWSTALYFYWHNGNDLQHIFIVAILIAVIAVRIIVASNFIPIILAGTGFLTIVIVLRFLFAGSALDFNVGAIVIVTEGFLLMLTRRLQETARDMLTYKEQREELIGRLERAKMLAETARQKAEEANMAKSKFLATMSHELRTPLNAIMGYSEILSQELMGPHAVAAYKGYASDIHYSGQHLLSLSNDILDLSRIEAGRQEMKDEPVSLAETGEECLKLMQHETQAKKLAVRTKLDRGLPMLMGDRRLINQIWLNLLSNSVKFTPEGGMVMAEIGIEKGGLFLRVSDTGLGIPSHEIETLRGAFIRGSYAVRRAVSGAGLGLSIVNGLAQLHGAELTIHSDLGKGTVISVGFPASRSCFRRDQAGLSDNTELAPSQRKLIAVTA
jgi:two-component system, cell cycle sensor histidine kinase PleC